LERSLVVLVLTRRPHEKIVLPGLNVTIQVVAIKGGTVRLGIDAPPDVQVLREELLDQSPAPALTGQDASKQLCLA
jgi:carbon storage regulator